MEQTEEARPDSSVLLPAPSGAVCAPQPRLGWSGPLHTASRDTLRSRGRLLFYTTGITADGFTVVVS